jgi:hypothetical protein
MMARGMPGVGMSGPGRTVRLLAVGSLAVLLGLWFVTGSFVAVASVPRGAGSPVLGAAARSTGPYAVTFSDRPFGAGLTWGVTVREAGAPVGSFSTTNASATLLLPAGSYTFSTVAPPGWVHTGASSFAVGSRAAKVTVGFGVAPGLATAIFPERGIEYGASWSITLYWDGVSKNGPPPPLNATETTTGSSLKFAIAKDADYCYQLGWPANYWGATDESGCFSTSTGHFTVSVIHFNGPAYNITFTETGLPNGSSVTWGVDFWGLTKYATGPTPIVFTELKGKGYWFIPVVPAGYSSDPAGFTKISLTGPAASEIGFTPT